MSGQQILQPSVSITVTSASVAAQNAAQKVLVVGQMISGTATPGTLVANVGNASEEDALFGASSMIAGMIRAFKKINKIVRLDVMPLADAGSGDHRLVTVIWAGTATAAGTITCVVGSEVNHSFELSVSTDDTAAEVSLAMAALINADGDCPFTANGSVAAMTLTADNDGAVMNDLGIEALTDTAGITITSVLETTPGSTDPTLTDVIDSATERYQAVVWAYAATTELTDYLDARLNPTNDVLDGVGFVSIQDTHANLIVTLDALNKQTLVMFVDEQVTETAVYLGPAQNEASYVKSSIFAAIRALRLTEDASIAQYVTSPSSRDQFGGAALATLPYFNTPLDLLPIIKSGRGFTQLEIESLFTSGGAVMGVNKSGNGALVGEVVTTYKTDPASNVDLTFKLLNTVDTVSAIREFYFNNYKKRFAQTRLTSGSVTRGRDMANQTIIEAYTDRLYLNLSDLVLVQDGEDAFEFFKDRRVVVLDLSVGKVTITMEMPIVTQLRTIIATIKVAFSLEG